MGLRNWIARNVAVPLDFWRSGNLGRLAYLREFERTQFLPPEALRDLQVARLRSLLEHAYRHCPFYRERLDAAGLRPGDVRAPEDLRALPPLEKREIQEQRDRIAAEGWPDRDRLANWTGGSTGSPLALYVDRDRTRSRWAATVRHNRWAGWEVGDRVAYLWGAPRDVPPDRPLSRLRRALIEPGLWLDTGHMTEERMERFHRELARFRPEIILAYARAVALFARFLKARGLAPHRPRGIVAAAESLDPDDRLVVEEVFGCPVFNRYGCREVSVIAAECPARGGLHVMAEGLLVEVVRGDRAAPPGSPGEVLVTDLLNRAMPLVRYRIGDVAAWDEGPCPCGRGLPRLKDVAGRVSDFIVGADGRMVSGVFLATYLVGRRPTLGQVQIRQDEAGKVLYRIHRGRDFRDAEDLGFLRDASREYLGEGTEVSWEFVEALAPEPSGKFLFCRSTVRPEFLGPPAPVGARP